MPDKGADGEEEHEVIHLGAGEGLGADGGVEAAGDENDSERIRDRIEHPHDLPTPVALDEVEVAFDEGVAGSQLLDGERHSGTSSCSSCLPVRARNTSSSEGFPPPAAGTSRLS